MSRSTPFSFVGMWPRSLFAEKEKGGLITKNIPALRLPGVYVLYNNEEPCYVGKADRLHKRLHDHANKLTDKYYLHWNYFCCFAFGKLPHYEQFETAEARKDFDEHIKSGLRQKLPDHVTGLTKYTRDEVRHAETILIAAIPRLWNAQTAHIKRARLPVELKAAAKAAAVGA